MGFRATVESQTARLTAAEQRVVTALLKNPGETAALPAAHIADNAGVHEATVTRLAQKLGYRGYSELRADLQRDAKTVESSAARVRARVAKAHDLSRLVGDEMTALSQLPEYLDQGSLDRAARALFDARRVYVFGSNHATTLVEFMGRRLRRLGLDVVKLSSLGRELAESAAALSSDDVILAFAFKTQPPGLDDLFRHASTLGSTTILVTDPPGVLFRPAPNQLLVAPRGADDDFHTLVVPLVICYALQLALTNIDPDRFSAALERVDTLARAYAANTSDFDPDGYIRNL